MNKQEEWFNANRHYLYLALAQVRQMIEGIDSPDPNNGENHKGKSLEEFAGEMEIPPPLETLCRIFGLSPFERNLLLLCAGVELDDHFAHIDPCFNLAMTHFPNAHWSALNPAAPLRRWRLLETGNGETLTKGKLSIDERVLHYMMGVSHTDERLMGIVKPLPPSPELVPSYRQLAHTIKRVWSADYDSGSPVMLPVIQLWGKEPITKQAITSFACSLLDLNLFKISVHALPPVLSELDALMRLWEREALLDDSVLFMDCDSMELTGKEYETLVTHFVEEIQSLLVISSRAPCSPRQRPVVTLHVDKPSSDEQKILWRQALGAHKRHLNNYVDRLVSQFHLGLPEIFSAGAEALAQGEAIKKASQSKDNGFGPALWNICRMKSRPKLDELAQRIEPAAAWDDLVLPASRKQVLREISLQVRWRARVYETWGFASKSSRGLGISALFTGASGTGKTMAAEVLAHELELDLYRIDLSQVVSKYIGETEKNLRRIFDAAEDGGVILFFDEADALFGKRTQVKDSHDRYANIEVSYLLQRMEEYRGLAILTTNMKEALDDAFLRRIRFIVKFPFPSPKERAQIWERIYPDATPRQDLDPQRLAQLNITGGNIRNIALNAAFLAAHEGKPLGMKHILQSVRSEYDKLEKTLNAVEIAGWLT